MSACHDLVVATEGLLVAIDRFVGHPDDVDRMAGLGRAVNSVRDVVARVRDEAARSEPVARGH